MSISYLALPPFVISMTAKKSSALIRLGEMSCQIFMHIILSKDKVTQGLVACKKPREGLEDLIVIIAQVFPKEKG